MKTGNMTIHYFKIALRNLLKYKTHSLITAICLSVGMVCFSIIGTLIEKIEGSTRSLPHFERRIDFKIPINDDPDDSQIWLFRANEVKDLEERNVAGIEMISYHSPKYDVEMVFIDKEQRELPYPIRCRRMNSAFFTMYDAKMLYGTYLPQTPNEVVISESCARKVYGTQNPVGMLVSPATYEEKKKEVYRIVNVVSDLSEEVNVNADIFIPYEESTFKGVLQVQGLLTTDADIKQVNQLLKQIKVNRDGNAMHYTVTLLTDEYNTPMRYTMILFITFLSSLILLSGVINFLKFIIQMFYNRQRELALRKCMGSDSKGLFCLLFAEVWWMFAIALLLSLALTEITVSCIYTYLPPDDMIPLHTPELIGKQFQVFLALLVVSIIVILFPICRLQCVSIIQRINRNNLRHPFRNTMLGVQLCICIFFFGIASGTAIYLNKINSHVYNPLSKSETERIIRLNINSITLDKQKEAILTDIRRMPEIERIVSTHSSGEALSNTSTVISYLDANGNSTDLLVQGGSPDYFTLFQIPVQGKQLEADAQGTIYISEAFARQLEQDSIQGMVTLDNETYRIGGVYKGLYKEFLGSQHDKGSVFFPSEKAYSYYFLVGLNGNVKATTKNIQEICRRYVPESIPLSIYTLDKENKRSYFSIEMGRNIAMLLASISLLLVVLSIYSSIAMDTMSRRKEVAIRKINGATPRMIALIFGKTYCFIYLLAFTIAFPLMYLLAIGITRKNDIFFSSFDFWLWGIGLFMGMAMLVILTTAYKIDRIMHINPAEIIKSE